MHELYYAIKGAMIGFIVAAPTGPVAVLCIKRTLNKGWFHGIATAVGATFGDAFYAVIAAFGLNFVIRFLTEEAFWLRLLGGCFLIGMGVYILLKRKTVRQPKKSLDSVDHLGETFMTALFLDLSNPITLLAYLAIFSGFGLSNVGQHLYATISLVLGVIAGASLWWFLLVQVTTLFKDKLNDRGLFILNKVSAILVLLFGVLILLTLIFNIRVFGKVF